MRNTWIGYRLRMPALLLVALLAHGKFTLQASAAESPAAAAQSAQNLITRAHILYQQAQEMRAKSITQAIALNDEARDVLSRAHATTISEDRVMSALAAQIDALSIDLTAKREVLEELHSKASKETGSGRLTSAEATIAGRPADIPATDERFSLNQLLVEIQTRRTRAIEWQRAGQNSLSERDGEEALRSFQRSLEMDRGRDLSVYINQAKALIGDGPDFTPPHRLYVSASQNMWLYARPFTSTGRFSYQGRPGDLTTSYLLQKPRVGRYDVAGFARLFRALAVGVSYSEHISAGDMLLTARVPVTASSSRMVELQESGTLRTERALHIEVGAIGQRGPVEVGAFIGPTRIRATQRLVESVGTSIRSDGVITLSPQIGTTTEVESDIGVHVLLDVRYMFSTFIGIGGYFRYTDADITFSDTAGPPVAAKLGGANVGWGVRFRF